MIAQLNQDKLLQMIEQQQRNDSKQPTHPLPQPQPLIQLTCVERATIFINRITDSICREIIEGTQLMNRRKSIPGHQQQTGDAKKKHHLELAKFDEEQHKKMICRFIRMSRKFQKNMEKRSMEVIESLTKIEEDEKKRKSEERSKAIEARKSQISQRLKAKEEMRNQLKLLVMQSDQRFKKAVKLKPLYIEKEEKFSKEFLLPRLEEQKRILQKKKETMRSIDISELLQHEKIYQQKRNSSRINRSLTSRVLQAQNHYEAPKFVPKSFLIMQAEQQLKKEQEKVKAQELQVNEYRKKQFLKMLQQKQRHENEKIREKNLENSLEKSMSRKSISILDQTISVKEKVKEKLTRQSVKKKGDDYMKQLIKYNRQRKVKSKAKADSQPTISIKTKPKMSQYEFEVMKQQRIQSFHKIRVKKIKDIVNNQRLDKSFKLQKLEHENQKMDELVKAKKDQLGTINENQAISLYLSSIHTKLAILQVASPKKQP